jgi:hypothetical protein
VIRTYLKDPEAKDLAPASFDLALRLQKLLEQNPPYFFCVILDSE